VGSTVTNLIEVRMSRMTDLQRKKKIIYLVIYGMYAHWCTCRRSWLRK